MKKEKKSHGVQLLLQMVVRDPDGKVISDTGEKPARSFLIQFLEFIYGMGLGTSLSATALAGSEAEIYDHDAASSSNLWLDVGSGYSTGGVIIGTGDTAETNTDYKLDVQLTEGTGAGNISYGATTIGTAAVVGSNVDLTVTRSFTNLTGSTITVKEAGLLNVGTAPNHLIVRDVLAASIDVPDKCSLTVIYTLRTTV